MGRQWPLIVPNVLCLVLAAFILVKLLPKRRVDAIADAVVPSTRRPDKIARLMWQRVMTSSAGGGQRSDDVHLVLSGLACRCKILADGNRQITAVLIPGDLCDPHVFILRAMDHSVGALSLCKTVSIARAQILEMFDRPTIARALWWSTLVDEATLREWLVNMGQRDTKERLAHLFCELHTRMKSVGLTEDGKFSFPVTQSDMAAAMGVSVVHVNRALQSLRGEYLVTVGRKKSLSSTLVG